MKFDLIKKDEKSKARAGIVTTDHGVIETPIFMPVGTVASVKGVHQRELKDDINPDIILGNTYHLYLRPQTDILEKAGGLHKFMNWDRNILTDSVITSYSIHYTKLYDPRCRCCPAPLPTPPATCQRPRLGR